MAFGISPDTLALKPSDVLNQLIQNRQIKAEYDRMELQRELARQQEQEAKQRQRESIAAQVKLAQMSESGAMGRLDKQLAAQAAETKPWAPGTEEEWMRTEGLRFEDKPLAPVIPDRQMIDGVLYERGSTGEWAPAQGVPTEKQGEQSPADLIAPVEETPEFQGVPYKQPEAIQRQPTLNEIISRAKTPEMARLGMSMFEASKTKEEKPAVTPAQALSILSDPQKARQLKRSYPDTYKQLEDIVKATFGSSNPLDTNIMDTNW